jgi:hypothetical protein
VNKVRLAEKDREVKSAVLQLYHRESPVADFNLQLQLAGDMPRLLLSGTVPTPVLPGPSAIDIHFVDEPNLLVLDGVRGVLMSSDRPVDISLRAHGEGIWVEGHALLRWWPLSSEGERIVSLELALVAAVVNG